MVQTYIDLAMYCLFHFPRSCVQRTFCPVKISVLWRRLPLLQPFVTCFLADELAGEEVSLLSYKPTTYVAVKGSKSFVMTTAPSKLRLVRPGLTKAPNTVSIMSLDKPDWYLCHVPHRNRRKRRLFLKQIANPQNDSIFEKHATFTEHVDVFHTGSTAFESVKYPGFFISRMPVRNKKLYMYILRPRYDLLKECASFTVNAFKKSASFSNGKITNMLLREWNVVLSCTAFVLRTRQLLVKCIYISL